MSLCRKHFQKTGDPAGCRATAELWEKLNDTLEEAMVLGDEVLIGQTILNKLDLHADCANRRLVPNPAHPDQPVTKVK